MIGIAAGGITNAEKALMYVCKIEGHTGSVSCFQENLYFFCGIPCKIFTFMAIKK